MWLVFYTAIGAGLIIGVAFYGFNILFAHDMAHRIWLGLGLAALVGVAIGFGYYLSFKFLLRAFTWPFLHRAQALTTKPIAPLAPVWASNEIDKLEEILDEALTTLERLDLFSEIAREIVVTLDPQKTLGRIVGTAVETLPGTYGLIFLLDEESQRYTVEAHYLLPLADRLVQQISFSVGEGVPGWVVVQGEPLIIHDAQQDPRVHPIIRDTGVRSLVSAPLVVGGGPLGVLNLFNDQDAAAFDEHDLHLLRIYADLAAVAINNARLYRRAEDERNKLSAVLNGTSDVIVVLDQAGDVMLLNPAATRYFKVQADEVIGRPVADLGISDLRAALVAARGSDGPITREIEVDADHTLYASVSPVEGVGWVMVMQDISSLKELDRLRTEWVAAVSHDLKNPITSLQMAVGLLAKSDTLTDSQRNLLAAMRRSSERLRTLVTDVLDLASLEAGPGLRAASLRPTSVIADAVAEVKRLAEDKEITLATDLAPSLPNVRGDAALLARALVNLLSNAIKYTQSGGRVTLRAAPQDGMVRVAVEDTGRGIPAEAIPHLFERFYRVPGSEDEAEGTGLGLSIVKSVVEKHGGDVMVESEVGQGSTFAFTVPICQQEVCE